MLVAPFIRHLLPWFTEQFPSPLAAAEVLSRLQAVTAPPLTWDSLFKPRPKALFRGKIGLTTFEIWRLSTGRNEMRPLIRGQIKLTKGHEGSLVQLRYRPSIFPLVCSALVILGLLLLVISLWDALFAGQVFACLPLLLLLLSSTSQAWFFWDEVYKARPLLLAQLQIPRSFGN